MITSKESQKAYIIQRVIENKITSQKAAGLLNLSLRHMRRLVSNVKKQGEEALVHKSRGKKAHNSIAVNIQKKIVYLYMHQYQKLSLICLTQRLNKDHDINISKESVRKILLSHGCRMKRVEKKSFDVSFDYLFDRGAVVQMNSIVADWFGKGRERCVLIYLMDEACFEIHAKFFPYEGSLFALETLVGYIQKYGIPLSLNIESYQAYASYQKMSLIDEQINHIYPSTLFEKAVSDVGIQVRAVRFEDVNAGRINIFLKNFQEKLMQGIKNHQIENITRANRFLKTFLDDFNEKFSLRKKMKVDRHKKGISSFMLKKMLVIKHECFLDQQQCVHWQNRVFKVLERVEEKKVFLVQTMDRGFYMRDIKGKNLKFKLIKEQSFLPHSHGKKSSVFVHVNPFSLKEIYI